MNAAPFLALLIAGLPSATADRSPHTSVVKAYLLEDTHVLFKRSQLQPDAKILEFKFGRQLNQPRCLSALDVAEGRVIPLTVDCSRTVELRMIECVERLQSQFHTCSIRNWDNLF